MLDIAQTSLSLFLLTRNYLCIAHSNTSVAVAAEERFLWTNELMPKASYTRSHGT